MLESRLQQGEQLLQKMLSLGITYDHLLAEGLHSKYLDQLFSRLCSRSSSQAPPPPPNPLSQSDQPSHLPQPPLPSTATPPQATITPAETLASEVTTSLATDVENFLHTLAPSISSPAADRHHD